MTAGVLLAAAALAWPEPTRDAKPWVYNWWMGSAVDAAGLEYQCAELEKAGFGGFHVIPIYGAKGYEKQWREFLSPAWAEGWSLANAAADRHNLGVDLTMGSGWCFGGPQLTKEQGVRALCAATNRAALPRGAQILWEGRAPARPPAAKMAALHAAADHPILLAQCLTGQSVKRAGPGGKGPMMDPFSTDAMDAFIRPYTAFFDQPGVPKPSHLYHDSYEYFKSGWTPALFDAFRAKRGYDLRDHLAELAGEGDREAVCRVKCDYRETLSDLIIEDVFPRWTAWCRARGIRTRNEAHGAPANLLDFYALADVPETEMFGKGDRSILISKFASSAAHVTGKPLVSSESCTWINEHFNETLAEAKVFLDRLFLAGVNHVFFHGFCYSPVDAVWPGWCFYASLQMNPRNPIWHDVPTLAAYITRCQSVFQTWTPDEDILVPGSRNSPSAGSARCCTTRGTHSTTFPIACSSERRRARSPFRRATACSWCRRAATCRRRRRAQSPRWRRRASAWCGKGLIWKQPGRCGCRSTRRTACSPRGSRKTGCGCILSPTRARAQKRSRRSAHSRSWIR